MTSTTPRLDSKAAIVTGAARGLGAAAAARLCRDGAAVLLTDVLEERGLQTVAELNRQGHDAAFLRHDVTSPSQWQDVVVFALQHFGRIDCLVNNAGINLPIRFEDATAEQLRQVLDVNLLGCFHGMQAVLPAMKQQGGGSIINIASNSTRKLLAETALYGTSKAALAYLTKAAAIDFGEKGYNIRVNSIHPGASRTEMIVGTEITEPIRALLDQLIAAIPLKRMGEPSDIADLVAFLASDESRYITAAEHFIDGGASVV